MFIPVIPMPIPQSRSLGILLVLASALIWSTAGLFTRMAGLDVWTMIGWRSLFSALLLGACWGLRRRTGPARPIDRAEIASALMGAVGGVTYVMALTWTTVANVMTIYATLPFVATAIAYLWLRERVTTRFVAAGLVAFAGVVVMVGASFAPRDLMGILAAVAMTLSFAAQLVISRRYPQMDTLRMVTLAAILCLLAALPMMRPGLPEGRALLACALYGGFSTGLGYVLVLAGSRIIGAAEAGLLSMLDVVMGPLWVWLFFAEHITPATALGGGTVFAAMLWYLAGDRRGGRRGGRQGGRQAQPG